MLHTSLRFLCLLLVTDWFGSTATTLAVFVPLLFWPGMIGEFMKYLPITVLVCLAAATIMSLIFIPVLGGLLVWKFRLSRTGT